MHLPLSNPPTRKMFSINAWKFPALIHVSLDQIMHIDSETTIFHGRNLDTRQFDFENYLQEILTNLKLINSAANKKMYYEAKDIPIFHHFQFPELATFKYFFWMKSVMYYPEYSKLHFEDNQLTDVFQKMGKEIIRTYSQIPSVEIWVVESINATIRQIEYYKDAGIFRKQETVDMLYDQLEALVNHISEQAEHGEKFVIGEKPKGNTGNYEPEFGIRKCLKICCQKQKSGTFFDV